uniref:Uncharacterized protein n=1 Tax=Fagus sylvatica TaxID=28930 RepID=A0A2N9ECT4_FAGSY
MVETRASQIGSREELKVQKQEVMKRLPVVEQPAMQPRQEEQSPNQVQLFGRANSNSSREAHGVPLGLREDQWGLNDKTWFDPRRGRPARERQGYQGATIDPYWQEQDTSMEPRKSKGPEANEAGLNSKVVIQRLGFGQQFPLHQVLEPEKVMLLNYEKPQL